MSEWRRKGIAAFTREDGQYPAYINIGYTESGMVQITVRGPRRADGTEGPVATCELNQWHFASLYDTAHKALRDSEIEKWPCRRCGAPVHPEDLCPCHHQPLNK